MASDQHSTPATHERLARLEENAAFAERLVEQLSEQVRGAFSEVRALRQRVESLERRLGSLQDRLETEDPGPEKPPHSA